MENNVTGNFFPNVNEEIINLMTVQHDITKNEISEYAGLLKELIDDGDKDILNDILIVKNKHLKMLKELYYRFKGERLEGKPERACEEEEKGCISSELGKAVLKELENAETDRSLEGDFLNQAVRDAFAEMTADSQNNALKFTVLLVKYS
ncbi:MAG: hypothetical protein LIO44_01870 [Eubacterium sp.]|nr:hypothetical protein [Eubacterium sp.]